jgi:uncharacterized membrane protein
MKTNKKNWLKYVLGLIICLLIRFIPFRPPNIEPILATQMPFSKEYGKKAAFLFAFSSIFLYDLITSKIGIWTLITALTYGLLGIWASVYLKNKQNNSWNYTKFAVIGTIFYDSVTGLLIGPIFFDQPFASALLGQIPFTILHLIGNISFAFVLSPCIYHLIIKNKTFERWSIIRIFNPKQL